MAAIYLGLTESAIDPLPPIRWAGGGAPGIPTDNSKQVEKASMLDGSTRFNFKSKHPRKWTLEWEMLKDTELADLITLNQYNQSLFFQNNWEDATWREVVIVGFSFDPFLNAGSTACRYSASMELEEVR